MSIDRVKDNENVAPVHIETIFDCKNKWDFSGKSKMENTIVCEITPNQQEKYLVLMDPTFKRLDLCVKLELL